MSESSDQTAAEAISAAEEKAASHSPAPAESARVDSVESGEGIVRAGAALPVPMPMRADSGASASAEKPKPTIDAISIDADMPHSRAKSGAAFRPFPPRQAASQPKKKGANDIWVRAAALAIAVGVGWLAGANTFDRSTDMARLVSHLQDTDAKLADLTKKTAHIVRAADVNAAKIDISAQKKTLDGLGRGLDAQRSALNIVKTSLDATRGEVDGLKTDLQSAQGDLTASKAAMAKLDKLAERIDRLEHQISSPVPTGSIVVPPAPAPVPLPPAPPAKDPHSAAAKDTKASIDKPKIPPNGYVLRDVQGGVATVEDQNGAHLVVPGEMLAGVGRVEAIERHGGRWVVVTTDGLIDSDPY
ncbi:MAG TPA: hypothetical protein VG271_04165 [Beijerinckiaceae bacterium]|nr:hypothetical protein [Beijerinckiaceae bacterium]